MINALAFLPLLLGMVIVTLFKGKTLGALVVPNIALVALNYFVTADLIGGEKGRIYALIFAGVGAAITVLAAGVFAQKKTTNWYASIFYFITLFPWYLSVSVSIVGILSLLVIFQAVSLYYSSKAAKTLDMGTLRFEQLRRTKYDEYINAFNGKLPKLSHSVIAATLVSMIVSVFY